MSESLIEFNNVSYTYEEEETEETKVVRNVSFSVKRGEFLCILGRNGSGKSTLAKLCNGIFLPSSGTVTVDGTDTKDEKHEFDVRKKVGVVFQNPDNQIVASIVEEDVAFGPENLGVEPKEIRRRVDDAMKTTGIYDYRLHETHRLSGGQKQRVAIAGILAMQPDCIVLDEPTAMLDPSGRRDVIDTVRTLNKENGKTVVLITHFMDEAALADRIIIVDDGKTVRQGSPKEIFSDAPFLKSCGLDVPDVTAIGLMLRAAGADLPPDILDEDEFVSAFARLTGRG